VSGQVQSIHITPREGEPMQPLDRVRAITGTGLEGDRYSEGTGRYSDGGDGRNLTLIESEVLADLAVHGILVPVAASRRNVTTSGIRLNDLVGRRIRVGDVECDGVRLCEPRLYLAGLVKQPVVKPLAHRGGLRADIVVGGEIRVGDAIVEIEAPELSAPR
jgi:MOSC domain-containing protein YiiM